MSKIDKSNWDDRFSAEEYVYGTAPNEFFKEQLDKLKPGRLLMLGEGEGRNAVYAAKMKWKTDAVDFSEQAQIKAMKLADREQVTINYRLSNLTDYNPKRNYYDTVGIIFFHLEKEDIAKIFTGAQEALKQEGVIICEVFSVNQLGRSSGGPKNRDLLYTVDEMKTLFSGLEIEYLEECTVELNEGILHQGEAKVIRFVGRRK